jgi:hypothetical protein
MVRYLIDFYGVDCAGNASKLYAAGQDYAESDETLRHVALGYAEPAPADTPDAPKSKKGA